MLTWLRRSAERVLAHIHAVEQHRALLRIVEPRQQTHERRLAAAGLADDRKRRARLNLHVDAVQNDALLRRVFEVHVPELDFAGRVLAAGGRRPAAHSGRSRISKMPAPAAMPCCTGPSPLVTERRDCEAVMIAEQERDEVADQHVAVDHLAHGEIQHHGQPERGDDLHDRVARRPWCR